MAAAISSAAQLQGGGQVSDLREERLDTLEDPFRLCGRGRLYCAFLKVDDHCSVCRLDFTGHRADDLPAYLVIVIVGHVLVPVILWIEVDYAPSLAFQASPSDYGLGLDSSLAAGQGRRRGAAMVAQDARLRRASARRIPVLRRKVP